jgi:hypothetical protein
VQVLNGLHAGDLLIVGGHRYVGPGQSVTIVSEPAAQSAVHETASEPPGAPPGPPSTPDVRAFPPSRVPTSADTP